MKLTRELIEETVKDRGYNWFDKGDYNLNIVGVRNSSTGDEVTNKFDDKITLSYKVEGEWKFYSFDATTDPGRYWVENIMRVEGVACLKLIFPFSIYNPFLLYISFPSILYILFSF